MKFSAGARGAFGSLRVTPVLRYDWLALTLSVPNGPLALALNLTLTLSLVLALARTLVLTPALTLTSVPLITLTWIRS